jgi:hypothetical protein
MTTPKPAPTDAPTEQDDREGKAIAAEIETWLDRADREWRAAQLIAAALQAEREATWTDAIYKVAEYYCRCDSLLLTGEHRDKCPERMSIQQWMEQAAQLPQGKETK